jgi:hypothetical protein
VHDSIHADKSSDALAAVRPRRVEPFDASLTMALAAHLRGAPRAELRHAVTAYVMKAKQSVTPPQDVIASLKAQIQRDTQPHMRADEYPQLMQLVVGWAIEDYYDR